MGDSTWETDARALLERCRWSLDGLEGDDYAGDVVEDITTLLRVGVDYQRCEGCGKYVPIDPEEDRTFHHAKRSCPLAKSRAALRAVVRKGRKR